MLYLLVFNFSDYTFSFHGYRYMWFHTKQNCGFSYLQNNMFITRFHIFLYRLKYFCNKQGARGWIFGHFFGSFKNNPKNVGIHPESLISHFGIIKTPSPLPKYIKKQRNESPKFVAVFWAPILSET